MKRRIFVVLAAFLALAACSSNKETGVNDYETTVREIVGNEQDIVVADEEWQEADDAEYLPQGMNEERSIIDRPETENAGIEANKKRVLTDELCTGVAKEIFEQTNTERIAQGTAPLLWDDELARCAGVRANEIITNFSHVRADGTKCYALSDLIWGENIARGPHATGAEFVEHWMASEGHKANILQKRYTTIGIAVTCTEHGDTAVQLFGID